MAKALNFNKVKKQYMTVTLSDEKQTTIMIGTPTKKLMDEFIVMGSQLDEATDNNAIMKDFYELSAKLMSRNKGGVKITREQLEDALDFEDLIIFMNAYTAFIQEISRSKN